MSRTVVPWLYQILKKDMGCFYGKAGIEFQRYKYDDWGNTDPVSHNPERSEGSG